MGQVVEGLESDPADNLIWFRVRVDEVIRGEAGQLIEIKHLFSGVPIERCDESILRVRINDRIAFAIEAQIRGVAGPVTTVAWLRADLAPTPPPAPGSLEEQVESTRDFLVPGVERLAVLEVRAFGAQPEPDAAASRAENELPVLPLVAVLLAATVAAVAFLRRLRERKSHPPG